MITYVTMQLILNDSGSSRSDDPQLETILRNIRSEREKFGITDQWFMFNPSFPEKGIVATNDVKVLESPNVVEITQAEAFTLRDAYDAAAPPTYNDPSEAP